MFFKRTLINRKVKIVKCIDPDAWIPEMTDMIGRTGTIVNQDKEFNTKVYLVSFPRYGKKYWYERKEFELL